MKILISEAQLKHIIKNSSNVHKTKDQFLQEIDFGPDAFGDTKHRCMPIEEIVLWLNNELERLKHNRQQKQIKNRIKSKDRDVFMGHGNIESLISDTGDVNIDMFIKNLTKEPSRVFDANPKMEKSDIGRKQLTINTGLPAIVGIVYDIENQKFLKVTTCPGAGPCVKTCYARDGFYRMNEDKIMKLTRRLNLLMNNPKKYEQRILDEIEKILTKLPDDYQLVIRWNDAGDFFSDVYFNVAKSVTLKLLNKGYNVKSYAYTKRAKYMKELNDNPKFVANFSTDASEAEKREFENWEKSTTAKLSHRVPAYDRQKIPYKRKEGYREVTIPLFKQFFKRKGPHLVKGPNGKPLFADEQAKEGLKDFIFNNFGAKFNFDRSSLRYTWELPYYDEGERKYNVIVMSTGDSDIAAQREDVRISFLLEH